MSQVSLLLNAYYEALYDRLAASRNLLAAKIEELLRQEIANPRFRGGDVMPAKAGAEFDDDKYAAYRDACLAFVEERIEAYNPIGIQYTFDRVRAKEVLELELQLNWYDSRAEFAALRQAAQDKAEAQMTEGRLKELADELIAELGAFPDRSIISAYEAQPALNKLPDYVVGRAIEQILQSNQK